MLQQKYELFVATLELYYFCWTKQNQKNMSILKSGKPVGLACDHAGYELKQVVMQELDAKGIAYKDFGTYSTDSCDYPDFAHPLALAVEQGECYPRHCHLRQRQRHKHDVEQTSGHSCCFVLDRGDCLSGPSAQRCQRAGDAGSFYLGRTGSSSGRHLPEYRLRRWSSSTPYRQDTRKIRAAQDRSGSTTRPRPIRRGCRRGWGASPSSQSVCLPSRWETGV